MSIARMGGGCLRTHAAVIVPVAMTVLPRVMVCA
jgi:hypothetical protein